MKILSLNIANYDDHPNWDTRVEIIAKILIEQAPDLIALQEVRFNPDNPSTASSYQDAAQQILAKTLELSGKKSSWANTSIITQPAMYYPSGVWQYPQKSPMQEWEGLSILSRTYPVIETGTLFLPTTDATSIVKDDNKRITQYTTFDRDFYLFNTHFSYEKSNAQDNSLMTVEYMQRFGGNLQLLVGDLNAVPENSEVIKPLEMAGLVDLWALLRGSESGYTFPSGLPAQRIDYCWASPALAARATHIELIGNETEKGIYPSDHLGLCVTFND